MVVLRLCTLKKQYEHPDMTEELAEALSTEAARLTYEVTADIEIGDK